MNVIHPLTNLISTSMAKAQHLAIEEVTADLNLRRGTVARILLTVAFADASLRDRIQDEAVAQIGATFTTRTDRCAVQVLVNDETEAALTSIAQSTGAGRGEVARAALIVAVAELDRFHEAFRAEAQAHAAAKARSKQQLINRLSRINRTNEVQA